MGSEETGRQLGSGTIESLREEFRGHLALFYSRLKLAAPMTASKRPWEPDQDAQSVAA